MNKALKTVADFNNTHGLRMGARVRLLDLLSETGELALRACYASMQRNTRAVRLRKILFFSKQGRERGAGRRILYTVGSRTVYRSKSR
jgi:hypothetical protein